MEDFNVPSEERIALLEQLQIAMGDAPPYFWAACQICDLEALEKLVELARECPAMACIAAGQTYKMVLHWNQRMEVTSETSPPIIDPQSGPGSPADSFPPAKRRKTTSESSAGVEAAGSPTPDRDQTPAALAKQRDNYQCVISGYDAVDAAHIYPFSSISKQEGDRFGPRHEFWNLLRMFWPAGRVAAWEAEIFPGGIHERGIERVQNRITLTKTLHGYWKRGAFALKPISQDEQKRTMKVGLYWQKKTSFPQGTINLTTAPCSTEGLDRHNGTFRERESSSDEPVWHRAGKVIISGDIIELTTDNPVARPLPSFEILEMQWFLQRVIGMTGAADVYDDWCEDSDEEISNLGLGEVED